MFMADQLVPVAEFSHKYAHFQKAAEKNRSYHLGILAKPVCTSLRQYYAPFFVLCIHMPFMLWPRKSISKRHA
jgi:hypothetical protein